MTQDPGFSSDKILQSYQELNSIDWNRSRWADEDDEPDWEDEDDWPEGSFGEGAL